MVALLVLPMPHQYDFTVDNSLITHTSITVSYRGYHYNASDKINEFVVLSHREGRANREVQIAEHIFARQLVLLSTVSRMCGDSNPYQEIFHLTTK